MTLAELVKSANQGNTEAQYKLGTCYYIGKMGLQENHAEAAKWFITAATNGHDENSMIMLVMMYFYGDGVGQNPAESERWRTQAILTDAYRQKQKN